MTNEEFQKITEENKICMFCKNFMNLSGEEGTHFCDSRYIDYTCERWKST